MSWGDWGSYLAGYWKALSHVGATSAWAPEVWAAVISTVGAVVMGLVGIGGAILGTKIGAKANQVATLAAAGQLAEVDRRRFIGERVWEERRRAYSLILTSLGLAGDFWSYLDDGFSEAGRDAEGFFQSESYRDWRKEALEHWWEAKRIFSENRLVLSDEFVERFTTLREEVAANDFDYDPPNEAHIMKAAFRKTLDELLKISKTEVFPV